MGEGGSLWKPTDANQEMSRCNLTDFPLSVWRVFVDTECECVSVSLPVPCPWVTGKVGESAAAGS